MGVISRRALGVGAAAAVVSTIAGCTHNDPDEATDPSTAAASGTPATSASTGSSGPTKPAGSIRILAGGDIFTNEGLIAQAKTDAGGSGYDFWPQLAGLKSLVSQADIAIGQLETPLTTTNTSLGRGIVHNSPHQLALALKKVGYDGCSFANNHTFDNGLAGMIMTRQIMTDAGLQLAGPRDAANGAAGQPAWYQANGFKVAQLSYSYTLDNFAEGSRTSTPPSAPWLKENLWAVVGAEGVIADAKAAREQGADIVIASMHWGTQFKFTVDDDIVELAHSIAESGAVDWIVGNHAHVVQGCDKVGGTVITYAMGNQLSDQGTQFGYPVQTQDGVSVEVTFERSTEGLISAKQVRYQPTWVDRLHGYRAYVVPRSGGAAAVDPQSWTRTTTAIMSRGNAWGVTPIS